MNVYGKRWNNIKKETLLNKEVLRREHLLDKVKNLDVYGVSEPATIVDTSGTTIQNTICMIVMVIAVTVYIWAGSAWLLSKLISCLVQ